MKKLALLLALAATFCGCEKFIPFTEQLTREKTIEVPGVSTSKLYTRVNEWAVWFFNDSKNAVEYRDKEEGLVTGKYWMAFKPPMIWDDPYTICAMFAVNVEEGKVRVKISPSTSPTDYPMSLRLAADNSLVMPSSRKNLMLHYFANVDAAIRSLENFLKDRGPTYSTQEDTPAAE